jgi:hypothetical protein
LLQRYLLRVEGHARAVGVRPGNCAAVEAAAPLRALWADLSPEGRVSAHRFSFDQATWDAEYTLRNASRSTMAQEPTQNTASETNANRSHREQEELQAGVGAADALHRGQEPEVEEGDSGGGMRRAW